MEPRHLRYFIAVAEEAVSHGRRNGWGRSSRR